MKTELQIPGDLNTELQSKVIFQDPMPGTQDLTLCPERITGDALPAFMQFGGPSLDMHETFDELIIRAEVPGLKKDDFSVELVGRRLTIKGEKKILRERKGGDGCLLSECRYGSFVRTLQLPYEVDEKTIVADLKHGVLTIRLPKPDKGQHARFRVPVS